jgi:hypothetical protein
VRRLLWIAVGLLLVGAGLYAVGTRTLRGADAPLDQIDAESRRQLERVLIDAERNGAGESR